MCVDSCIVPTHINFPPHTHTPQLLCVYALDALMINVQPKNAGFAIMGLSPDAEAALRKSLHKTFKEFDADGAGRSTQRKSMT